MNVYLFDVDKTLWCSGGPVQLKQLEYLKSQGHIVGTNGNPGPIIALNLQGFLSVFRTSEQKVDFANSVKALFPHCEHYCWIGNDPHNPGFEDQMNDKEFAAQSGYEFIRENDFKEGL